MKMNLNNLLSFNDFDGTNSFKQQKRTKRTEVGFDVLNESFYDKLIYKVENDRPLDDVLTEFVNRIIKSITSGQVTDLEDDNGSYKFTVLGRDFKLTQDGGNYVSVKTPQNREYSTFEIPSDDMSKIIEELDDIEYL